MRPSGVVMLTAARNTWTTALKHLQPKPLGSVLLKLLVHMMNKKQGVIVMENFGNSEKHAEENRNDQ